VQTPPPVCTAGEGRRKGELIESESQRDGLDWTPKIYDRLPPLENCNLL